MSVEICAKTTRDLKLMWKTRNTLCYTNESKGNKKIHRSKTGKRQNLRNKLNWNLETNEMDFIGPCLKQNGSHLSLRFKLTSALFVATNREITPLDYHFCYSELQRPLPGVVFLTIKLQWLPPLLLEGTHHFPPKHSISWRDEKTPSLRATYHDSTIVQSALFAASLVLINSSLVARSTVGFHLASLGVTSSWMVSQLTGAARLLCCDNISFDVEVLVLGCHASSLLLFLSILLGVDLTAVTRRGKPTGMTWKCDGGTQAAIMFDFYIYFSPSFFPPLMPFQHACTHTKRDVSIFLD